MTPAASSRAEFKVRFRSGPGVLRIDPLGLHIASRPRRFGFIRRDQRFVARRQIRNIYRQAENVRIGFRDEARDSLLEFWADDAAAASEIVGHLPTSYTVESDGTSSRTVPRSRIPFPSRILGTVVLAIACAFAGAWWVKKFSEHATLPATATTHAIDEIRLVATKPEPAITAAEMQLLQDDWDHYMTIRSGLRDEFMAWFDALQRGAVDRTSFIAHVDQSLAPDWAREAARLGNGLPQLHTRRERLRDALNAAASNWEHSLRRYADALAADSSAMVWAAFDSMRDAEQAELEARLLVEQAQK